jgi:hypothetical protein
MSNAPDITPAQPQFAIASQFKPKETVEVAITDPFGQPTPIRITLAGRYTKAFKAALALIQDGNDESRVIDLLVAATTAWEGVLDAEGQPMPCEAHLVRALYSHPDLPWLAAQVSAAFTDQSRFFESAKAS